MLITSTIASCLLLGLPSKFPDDKIHTARSDDVCFPALHLLGLVLHTNISLVCVTNHVQTCTFFVLQKCVDVFFLVAEIAQDQKMTDMQSNKVANHNTTFCV